MKMKALVAVIFALVLLVALGVPAFADEGEPNGWDKGKKSGWDEPSPPGLDKKDKTPPGFFDKGNSITNIILSPPSPASLAFGENVVITFDYEINRGDAVLIFVRPFTGGSPTPNYAAHPSPTYAGNSSGSGSGYFTILSGAVTVDQLRFEIVNYNVKQTPVFLEFFIDVDYQFNSPLPDLIVEEIWSTTDPLEAGKLVSVTVRIKNQGTVSITTPFELNFSFDGSLGTNTLIGSLGPSATLEMTYGITWPSDLNPHELAFFVDSTSAIVESDETNNIRTKNLTASSS